MYRKIDLADIMGSALAHDDDMQSISRIRIGKVIVDLRKDDEHKYIRVDISPSAMRRVRSISDGTVYLENENVVIPSNPEIRDRFVKTFHQLDIEVQTTVNHVVKIVLSHE